MTTPPANAGLRHYLEAGRGLAARPGAEVSQGERGDAEGTIADGQFDRPRQAKIALLVILVCVALSVAVVVFLLT